MKSKCLNFLLNEEETNRIAKDILNNISLNLFEIENLSRFLIRDSKYNLAIDIKVTASTKSDFKFSPKLKKIIRTKNLILNDLGYCSLDFFKYILKMVI